jgi:hypothetical protein
MMRIFTRRIGLGLVCCLAVAALCAGCDTGGDVRLIAVYPADEPNLLDLADVKVVQLEIDVLDPSRRDDKPIASEILARGEAVQFGDLAEGPWIVVVRGINAVGVEVVYGESQPFKIAKSAATDVRIFMGRLQRFNFVDLSPSDVASDIGRLQGHTATPFTDRDGKQWILITGGYAAGEVASADAYLVDPGNFTAAKLDATMSKPRLNHRAIAVEPPGRTPLVVIADGGSGPVNALEVFDTATTEFRTMEIPCGPAASAGIVAALTRDAHGALVPSGRVILPGTELCVIDPYGDKPAETWPSTSGEAVVPPALSATNAAGQLVIVDGDGAVSVASAVEGGFPTDGCFESAEGVGSHIAPRAGGTLVAVGDRDRFAVIGGEDPDGKAPSSDWALVSLSGCDVIDIVEGGSGRGDAMLAPVVFDLSSTDSSPIVDLLVTGGNEEAAPNSAVLIGDTAGDVPLWYENAVGHTPATRAARLGYAVAVLDNRSAWVIGGGNGPDAEIFVLGDGAAPLGSETREFALRRPVLTAMNVLDTTEATDQLTAVIKDDAFLATLFGQQVTATMYMLSSAERGIGDKLTLDYNLLPAYKANCTADDISVSSPIIGGVVNGDPTGIDIPAQIDPDPAENGDEAIEIAKDVISNATQGVKAFSLGGEGAPPHGILPAIGGETGGPCPWRQYIRVGFDGLGFEGATKDATYSGVNVLIWAISGDDCSQGVYNGVTDLSALPSEEDLETIHCGDTLMDDYFGLPPDETLESAAFSDVVNGLVWDPRDLIIGIVGQEDPSGASAGTKSGLLPRRLRHVTEFLSDMGAEIVPLFVEDTKTAQGLSEQLDELATRIAARNPRQVCIPDDLVGGYTAPFVAGIGEKGGLFLPLDPGDPWTMSTVAEMRDLVGDRCRVFRVDAVPGGASEPSSRFVSDEESWKIGTDTDRRAGCSRGWTVYLDPEEEQSLSGGLYIQCTPD